MQRILLTLFIFFTFNAVQANESVHLLQHEWAVIKYQTQGKTKQLSQFESLVNKAQAAAEKSPDSAEIKVWQAIILSTQAGVKGGIGALKLVKKSRQLLQEAEKINANVLDGSIYTSLGSLYYQVPKWPLGFGNKGKARSYLTKALKINPQGIDPNYFYGDFLIQEGNYKQAIDVLNVALAAPARPNRPIADKGRRAEVKQLIAKANKLAEPSK